VNNPEKVVVVGLRHYRGYCILQAMRRLLSLFIIRTATLEYTGGRL
jgi:hypothetical protein